MSSCPRARRSYCCFASPTDPVRRRAALCSRSGFGRTLEASRKPTARRFAMRRYLVVAHQTLTSQELLDAMRAKLGRKDETEFHLLVPIHHGEPGLTWTEGHDRGVAMKRLDEALLKMTAEGFSVSGEVGTDSPVESV